MASFSRLPALAESAFWRYVNFIVLYFTEGLPQGMLFIGIPAWMAAEGKSAVEIGAFAVSCSLPWSFKFVVAPAIDRWTYLPMGRKRPWVLFGHVGLILGLIGIAFVPDPLNNLGTLNIAAFILSACGALQDAAGDAMAVDIIPEDQQARANGYMQGSRMLGSSLALALGSFILKAYSFRAAMLSICGLVVVITLVPLLLRENRGEKILPFTPGEASPASKAMQMTDWPTILRALFKAFSLKNSLLVVALMFVTQGAYNYFEHLLPLFTVARTGWDNVDYSSTFAIADIVGGISGIIVGGWIIQRYGIRLMVGVFFAILISLALVLAFYEPLGASSDWMDGYLITYRLFNAFAKIGVFSVAMQCCSKYVSASQYTIYMTMGAMGSIAGAALIGPMREQFSFEICFVIFAGFLGLAWGILRLVSLKGDVEGELV